MSDDSNARPTYVALACHQDANQDVLGALKGKVSACCEEVLRFDVPQTLKFGSFDSLIKLMDDLQKYDNQVEGVLRRIERSMLELDKNSEFKVLWRNKTMTVASYVRAFVWDDTKLPRNRPLLDNLNHLSTSVQRVDEEVKSKVYSFGDVKQSLQNIQKSRTGVGAGGATTLATAELIDVLTPDVVQADDFIVGKEHLQTVLCIVPRAQDKAFLDSYERFSEFVCPRSARKFEKVVSGKVTPVADRDGSTIWRFVCFKKAVEEVKAAAKAHAQKFVVRDNFTYSAEAFKAANERYQTLLAEFERQELGLKRRCAAAFSDCLVMWVHLKAMRVFVESILRYGVPPKFQSFLVRVGGGKGGQANPKNVAKLRSSLNEMFASSAAFGQSHMETGKGKKSDGDGEGEDGAYFPYVSLSFMPMSVPAQ